jgi:hypothetical protein
MIIMENLIPRGFVVLQHGDPKEQNKDLILIFIQILSTSLSMSTLWLINCTVPELIVLHKVQ